MFALARLWFIWLPKIDFADVCSSPSLRSGERPSGDLQVFSDPVVSDRNPTDQRDCQRVRKRLSDTLRPLQAKRSGIVRITASETSDQRNHLVVGTGSAVSPVSPLLVCAGLPARPIRRSCHPRRFTAFPSLVGLGLATVPALVVHFQERIRPGRPGCFRPVSQATGFPQCLTPRRVRDASASRRY